MPLVLAKQNQLKYRPFHSGSFCKSKKLTTQAIRMLEPSPLNSASATTTSVIIIVVVSDSLQIQLTQLIAHSERRSSVNRHKTELSEMHLYLAKLENIR